MLLLLLLLCVFVSPSATTNALTEEAMNDVALTRNPLVEHYEAPTVQSVDLFSHQPPTDVPQITEEVIRYLLIYMYILKKVHLFILLSLFLYLFKKKKKKCKTRHPKMNLFVFLKM